MSNSHVKVQWENHVIHPYLISFSPLWAIHTGVFKTNVVETAVQGQMAFDINQITLPFVSWNGQYSHYARHTMGINVTFN